MARRLKEPIKIDEGDSLFAQMTPYFVLLILVSIGAYFFVKRIERENLRLGIHQKVSNAFDSVRRILHDERACSFSVSELGQPFFSLRDSKGQVLKKTEAGELLIPDVTIQSYRVHKVDVAYEAFELFEFVAEYESRNSAAGTFRIQKRERFYGKLEGSEIKSCINEYSEVLADQLQTGEFQQVYDNILGKGINRELCFVLEGTPECELGGALDDRLARASERTLNSYYVLESHE